MAGGDTRYWSGSSSVLIITTSDVQDPVLISLRARDALVVVVHYIICWDNTHRASDSTDATLGKAKDRICVALVNDRIPEYLPPTLPRPSSTPENQIKDSKVTKKIHVKQVRFKTTKWCLCELGMRILFISMLQLNFPAPHICILILLVEDNIRIAEFFPKIFLLKQLRSVIFW